MAIKFADIARPELRKVTPYVPGRPIEDVQRELGLRRISKMASNENALGPSPKALVAVQKALGQLHRYPDGSALLLKEALAKHWGVRRSELVAANGSDELIVMALRALVRSGENIVVSRPTFLIYEIAARVEGIPVRAVPMKRLRYDLPAMRRAVNAKTRLLFIANPDNPTGSYVTHDELHALLRGLPKRVVVFIDEAYYEYALQTDYPRALRLFRRYPVIVTRSFSKAYGLAGLRVGYGIAQRGVIEALERVREPFNVNSLAQAAAVAALNDRKHLRDTLALVEKGRKTFETAFRRWDLSWMPSATNFLLVDVGRSAAPIARALLRQGVIVRDMAAWKLQQHLRITFGTHDENQHCLRALAKALKIS